MLQLDLVLNPSKLMSDFESGLLPALRAHFPNAAIKGCYFHHTKAIWSKVQELGLVVPFNSTPTVRREIRKMMHLAFLPVLVVVRTSFLAIKTSPAMQTEPLQQLCSYYSNTWLNGNFPMSTWNISQEVMRTNNSVEGWHNKLNRAIGKLHPNIYELLKHIKKEQREVEVTVAQADLGAEGPPTRLKYRELQKKIHKLQQKLQKGRLTPEEFLRKISHKTHHFHQ